MKTKIRISIIILLGILIVYSLLKFNFYKAKSDYNTHYTAEVFVKTSESTVKLISINENSRASGNSTHYGFTFNKKNDASNAIDFLPKEGIHKVFANGRISNIEYSNSTTIGLGRFIPLYKTISFRSKINTKWNVSKQDSIYLHLKSKKEIIDIKGQINIFGSCSPWEARNLVEKLILAETKKAIRVHYYNKLMTKI